MTRMNTIAGCCLVAAFTVPVLAQKPFAKEREKMVKQFVIGSGVKDARVTQAIEDTLRHEFVPTALRSQAYYDMALPIGYEQTISSPFIVAFMTASLEPKPTDVVLEIGTGSGYQAAVLSPLVKQVYSIEIVEPLGRKAARVLERLGYSNVTTKVGDGYKGWAEHAPFDKIIVTCSPEKVPQALTDQLREGGMMVIPVGERYQQILYLFRKKDGKLVEVAQRPTLFVPMTGAAEQKRIKKPDAAKPDIVNGDFEIQPKKGEFVPGWYYQRLVEMKSGGPNGNYLEFKNDEPGRSSHILQGFAIDGSKVASLTIRARVKTRNIKPGRNRDERPFIALSFYDNNRRDLGLVTIGPFKGNRDWFQINRQIRVPQRAAESLIRVGLFGATGEMQVDEIKVTYKSR